MIVEVKNAGHGEYEGPCLYVQLSEEVKDPSQKYPTAFYFDAGRGAEQETTLFEWERVERGCMLISHIHSDHIVMFTELSDHFLTTLKSMTVYGPKRDPVSGRGIIESVQNTLNTYIAGQNINFTFRIYEIGEGTSICSVLKQDKNRNFVEIDRNRIDTPIDKYGIITVTDNPEFTLKTLYVKHDIPTLAFFLMEKICKMNFDAKRINDLGIEFEEWGGNLRKNCFDLLGTYQGDKEKALEYLIQKLGNRQIGNYPYTVRDLIELGVLNFTLGPNSKIAYITDTVIDPENQSLIKLAENSDLLACEARSISYGKRKYHTSFQDAKNFAKKANVSKVVCMHSGHDANYLPQFLIQAEKDEPLIEGSKHANSREREMVDEAIEAIVEFTSETRSMHIATSCWQETSELVKNLFVLGIDAKKLKEGELYYKGMPLKV